MAMPMSEVTENLVLAGEGKTKRPQSQMVVLGIMAGALIAAGAMASSVAMHAISNAGLARLTAGLVFPIGFVLMALFGGELFTGDCLMVIGALKHRYRAIRRSACFAWSLCRISWVAFSLPDSLPSAGSSESEMVQSERLPLNLPSRKRVSLS